MGVTWSMVVVVRMERSWWDLEAVDGSDRGGDGGGGYGRGRKQGYLPRDVIVAGREQVVSGGTDLGMDIKSLVLCIRTEIFVRDIQARSRQADKLISEIKTQGRGLQGVDILELSADRWYLNFF